MKAEHANSIRQPAVAGRFYPSDPGELRETVDALLGQASSEPDATVPKALIAPHAGYIYSGPVAASAYALWRPARVTLRRVIMLGPSHWVAFEGLALSSHSAFQTPLGLVPIDPGAAELLCLLPQVSVLDEGHGREHSLEVQLPFLQRVLAHFQIIPLVVGDAEPEAVAEVLEALWGGSETGIVISSDLSHYHTYPIARECDRQTAHVIEALDPDQLTPAQACGGHPIRGLLLAASRHHLSARTLDLRNSGDTAGPRDQVVGYGAFAFDSGPRR